MPIDVEDDELEGLTDEEREARKKAIGGPIGGDVRPTLPPARSTDVTAPKIGAAPAPEKAPGIGEPITSPGPFAPRPAYERYQKLSQEQQKPWGDLGVGGKISRVAETIGGVINPSATSMIPGTRLHHQREVAGARTAAEEENKEIGNIEGEKFERARTEEQNAMADQARARAEALRHPQAKPLPDKPEALAQEYADAVKAAVANGVDPSQDPEVQRYADAITSIRKPAGEKIPPTKVTVQADGKPHVMERNPQSGAYDVDRGIAPASYGQVMPATHTTEILGPDGVMHRIQFNPETGRFDRDIGAAPTGTAAHQIFQATAIEQLAPQIVADINANREILGKLSSYYKQWTAGTPVSDPKAAELMTELMSFAAMQPALHAFRSTNALEAFEKIIGGLAKNPDATIATIQGILKTPQAFTNIVKPGGGNNPPKNKPKEEMEWDAKAGKYVPKKKT